MKIHPAAIAIAALTIAPAALAGVVGPTFATYTSFSAGNLDGVDFTIAQTGGGALTAGRLSTASMTSASWDSVGSQTDVEYGSSNQITITFASAVSDLSMYLYYWRTAGTQGYADYTFSEAFTTNASFSGSTAGGIVVVTGTGFSNGILNFTGPVTTLTITGAGGTPGGSLQGFTMSQPAGSVAVPGVGGIAALAGIGLVGRRRRR